MITERFLAVCSRFLFTKQEERMGREAILALHTRFGKYRTALVALGYLATNLAAKAAYHVLRCWNRLGLLLLTGISVFDSYWYRWLLACRWDLYSRHSLFWFTCSILSQPFHNGRFLSSSSPVGLLRHDPSQVRECFFFSHTSAQHTSQRCPRMWFILTWFIFLTFFCRFHLCRFLNAKVLCKVPRCVKGVSWSKELKCVRERFLQARAELKWNRRWCNVFCAACDVTRFVVAGLSCSSFLVLLLCSFRRQTQLPLQTARPCNRAYFS